MNNRVIVTGGAGFIGSYVTKLLCDEGYETIVYDNLSSGKIDNIDKRAIFIKGNITDLSLLRNTIKEGDCVIHMAAIVSVPISIEEPYSTFNTNVVGFASVLEVCRLKKAKGIILSSSAAVYGENEGTQEENNPKNPNTPYGVHKLQDEELATLYSKVYGLNTISLRYFNVYGKGHHETGSYAPVIAKFLKQKKDNSPFTIIGDGLQTRDFIHVKDVANANVCALKVIEKGESGIYNICSGVSHTIVNIAKMIDLKRNTQNLPARTEIRTSCGKNTLAKNKLNWEPTIALEEGVRELL